METRLTNELIEAASLAAIPYYDENNVLQTKANDHPNDPYIICDTQTPSLCLQVSLKTKNFLFKKNDKGRIVEYVLGTPSQIGLEKARWNVMEIASKVDIEDEPHLKKKERGRAQDITHNEDKSALQKPSEERKTDHPHSGKMPAAQNKAESPWVKRKRWIANAIKRMVLRNILIESLFKSGKSSAGMSFATITLVTGATALFAWGVYSILETNAGAGKRGITAVGASSKFTPTETGKSNGESGDIANAAPQFASGRAPVSATAPFATEEESRGGPTRNNDSQTRLAGTSASSATAPSSPAVSQQRSGTSPAAAGGGGGGGAAAAAAAANNNVTPGNGNVRNLDSQTHKELPEIGAQNPSDSSPKSGRTPASSSYVMPAGFVIPVILLAEVDPNSSGQVLGEVRENVYDRKSGHLLIPQGTRLVGQHISHISGGQKRILFAWTRMILPGNSQVDIQGMPDFAQGGKYSEGAPQANSSYARAFGRSALLSLIVPIAKKDAPQSSREAGLSAAEMILQQNMNFHPARELRPGYAFTAVAVKDIPLPRPREK